jgi:hypothetical protein
LPRIKSPPAGCPARGRFVLDLLLWMPRWQKQGRIQITDNGFG